MIPTPAEIEAAKTPAGGWTRAQLAEWDIPWPPPKGWKARLLAERELLDIFGDDDCDCGYCNENWPVPRGLIVC